MIHHELLDTDPDEFLSLSLQTLPQRKQRLLALFRVPTGYVVITEDLSPVPSGISPDIGQDVKGGGAV